MNNKISDVDAEKIYSRIVFFPCVYNKWVTKKLNVGKIPRFKLRKLKMKSSSYGLRERKQRYIMGWIGIDIFGIVNW